MADGDWQKLSLTLQPPVLVRINASRARRVSRLTVGVMVPLLTATAAALAWTLLRPGIPALAAAVLSLVIASAVMGFCLLQRGRAIVEQRPWRGETVAACRELAPFERIVAAYLFISSLALLVVALATLNDGAGW